MEETTSWKHHTFTLFIFGGIIVLCSIFFTLGMVVGRSQGRQLAETDLQERENKKSPAEVAGDNFQLNYFDETTGDNPDLTLKPTPARPAAPAPGKEERGASSKPETVRAATPPTPSKPSATTAATRYLQVAATRSDKQADEELKKVRSKSFEAKILIQNDDKGKLYRVVVGPYKESEVSLAKKDLQAKGYKGVFVAK